MDREEFLSLVRAESPSKLARAFLTAQDVAAFPTTALYDAFKQRIADTFANTERVHLAGSGNWGYSLHPEKGFKAFDEQSDIDVAVVSYEHFHSLWNEMRRCHRNRWVYLTEQERSSLRRNGENVYAGFISPLWLPDVRSTHRLKFRRHFNRLSDKDVGYRSVKAYFFKNLDEAISYYERGFTKAQRALQ
jgi:hypothetical protein